MSISPGPWTTAQAFDPTTDDGCSYTAVFDANGLMVCSVITGTDSGSDSGKELTTAEQDKAQGAANLKAVKLIPDMLEVLRGLLAWADYMGGWETEEFETARQIVEELS